MAIPSHIVIKNDELPDTPGVYFYYDADGKLLYIGKATSLKARVGSYFLKAHNERLTQLVAAIARIDYIETPTVIEALVLEANQVHALQPPYNVLLKDDKSFLYLTITNEPFPKPLFMRGLELERMGINPFSKTLTAKTKKKFIAVFGPYTSGYALKKALELVRKAIPWSVCEPGGHGSRPCFDHQIGKCPGVCVGEISKRDYRKIIRKLIWFFEGKTGAVRREIAKEMQAAADRHEFELAAKLRNQLRSLEHIQDIALITREDVTLPMIETSERFIDLDGRIEAYDISNISGTSATGSMVVFEHGKPAKDKYRKFKIKTVTGANDYAMLEEMLRRRLARAISSPKAWPLPEVMVIDGGEGQVGRVRKVMDEMGLSFPLIGIAKGFDRKQDRLVFDKNDVELVRLSTAGKELFQKARDEAHRFAVSYHRILRAERFGVVNLKKRSDNRYS